MRKNHFQLMVASGIVLSLVFFLAPTFSGADPDLPDEAFVQKIPADDPFPHQAELAARVNFWRHVFGVWDRRQVVLHDMDNPGLVYEVLTVPESGADGRNVDRAAFIRGPFEDLVNRLHVLEQKVAYGDALDAGEQELLTKFRTLGKISQLPGAHNRVRVQSGVREKFLEGVKVSGRYDGLFRKIFRSYGVPEDLAFLPHVESSFQVNARSGVGAVGIWQFTLPAARLFMNVNAAVDERYDPVLAAEGCARYLAHAYAQLGDWGLAVTSYNHGIGGMMKAKSEFGTNFPRILEEYGGSQFGFDSRNFYVEFLAARDVARNAERYFGTVHREQPLNWEKVALENPASIYKVARDYGVTLSELTEINASLTTRAVKGRVSLPANTSIWLPEGTQQRLAARSGEEGAIAIAQPIRVTRSSQPTGASMVATIEDSSFVGRRASATQERRIATTEDDEDSDDTRVKHVLKNTAPEHRRASKVAAREDDDEEDVRPQNKNNASLRPGVKTAKVALMAEKVTPTSKNGSATRVNNAISVKSVSTSKEPNGNHPIAKNPQEKTLPKGTPTPLSSAKGKGHATPMAKGATAKTMLKSSHLSLHKKAAAKQLAAAPKNLGGREG